MATAVEKVFTTPELLEAILLEVDDMRTLLFSQRVDRTFKATIESSINLQRVLWFKPMPPGSPQTQAKGHCNPLIRKHRTQSSGMKTINSSGWCITRDEDYVRLCRDIDFVILPRREGSWRQMLLFQPGAFPEYWMVAFPHGNGVDAEVWRIMCFTTTHLRPHVVGYLNFGNRSDAATADKILEDIATYTAALKQKVDCNHPLVQWCWLKKDQYVRGRFETWYATMRHGQPTWRV